MDLNDVTLADIIRIVGAFTGSQVADQTKADQTKAVKSPRWLLVTNAHRGVRYGRNDTWRAGDGAIVLTDARRVFEWTASDMGRGIDSLATVGPQAGSRIGPVVAELTEIEPCTVVVCSDESRAAWESASWG